MKKSFFILLTSATLTIMSCNNQEPKAEEKLGVEEAMQKATEVLVDTNHVVEPMADTTKPAAH